MNNLTYPTKKKALFRGLSFLLDISVIIYATKVTLANVLATTTTTELMFLVANIPYV
ncbi:MAG: hypothetical protein KBC17_01935 [Candidatus Pacebacteria bacterium]|nr:hypothetical protein [Candidatus Paceibacterota bacterium]